MVNPSRKKKGKPNLRSPHSKEKVKFLLEVFGRDKLRSILDSLYRECKSIKCVVERFNRFIKLLNCRVGKSTIIKLMDIVGVEVKPATIQSFKVGLVSLESPPTKTVPPFKKVPKAIPIFRANSGVKSSP